MAYFAQIEDGTVRQVVVVDNSVVADDGTEEGVGQAYLEDIGLVGVWVQTSYTGSFRGCFAGVGMCWTGTEFIQPSNEEA